MYLHDFQKTKTLYSGIPKTYILIITKTDKKNVPIAPRRTQKGNSKYGLQAINADGTIHTKKTKKNSPELDMINLVCCIHSEISGSET